MACWYIGGYNILWLIDCEASLLDQPFIFQFFGQSNQLPPTDITSSDIPVSQEGVYLLTRRLKAIPWDFFTSKHSIRIKL